MKIFKDTVTNKIYSFEDNIIVTNISSVYSFKTPSGNQLNVPTTLQPYTIPTPNPATVAAQQQQATINNYAMALTNAINTVAQSWQYDTVYTAATYLNSAIPQFAHEAAALVSWRDQAWNNAQILLAQVTAGTTTLPATSQAFLSLVLPTTPTRPTS